MAERLRLGVLFSRVRVEEKWIFAALEQRGVDYERLDDRKVFFDLEYPGEWQQFDAILERSIRYSSGLNILKNFKCMGNSHHK